MSEPLVPVAISSEFDTLGRERLHAANYELMSRFTYVAPSIPTLSGDLPNSYKSYIVNYQYTIDGGVAPNTVTLDSGSLPTGLSISTSGYVSGTLTARGSYTWTLRVTDSYGDSTTLTDSADILALSTVLIGNESKFFNGPRSALLVDTTTGLTDTFKTEIEPEYRVGGYICYNGASTWQVAKYDPLTNSFTYLTVSGTKYGVYATMSYDTNWVVSALDAGSTISLYVYQRSGNTLTLFGGPYSVATATISRIKFSPDDSKIAQLFGGNSLRIHTFDTTTGILTVGSSISVTATNFAWHPGSRYLALCTNAPIGSNGSLGVRDTATAGYPVVGSVAAAGSGNRTAVTFHPNGNFIYASSAQGSGSTWGTGVFSFSPSTGVANITSILNTGLISCLSVSHDGNWLAAAPYDGTNLYIYSINSSTGIITASQTLTGVGGKICKWINYDLEGGEL